MVLASLVGNVSFVSDGFVLSDCFFREIWLRFSVMSQSITVATFALFGFSDFMATFQENVSFERVDFVRLICFFPGQCLRSLWLFLSRNMSSF